MGEKDFTNEVIDNLPDITKSPFKPIQRRYLKIILINLFIVFFLIYLALFGVLFFDLITEINEYSLLLQFIIFVLFICSCIYSVASFYRRKYLLREKDISYQSGLLIHTLTTVPFSRIQHVEIDQGPISRILKLASLSVYTAGDSSDDLEIKGIDLEEAQKIKEFISSKINE